MTAWKAIEIDGNDGTGKSTLVANLARYGIQAADRGRMTRATDDPTLEPEEGTHYILLDAPPSICQSRLQAAGKDITEKYHTLDDLQHYSSKFDEVARRFKAQRIPSQHPVQTTLQAISHILGHTLNLGFPKGRLQEVAEAHLESAGIWWPWKAWEARALTATSCGVTAHLLKPRSIPQMVVLGYIDVGLVGRDVLLDSVYNEDIVEVADTKQMPVKLMAAAANPHILTDPPRRPLVVATEYEHVASRWLTGLGIAHGILHTHGSTEAFCPRFADLIVDVVETGETLAANGLEPLHEFAISTLVLIARKGDGNPATRAMADALRSC